MIQGGHRSQRDSRTPRRCSRKTSEESQSSPRINIPPVEQRRSRPDGGKAVGHPRRQHGPRRASESALLPPIKLSSFRQPSTSSPTHDANEASSPTSHLSFPLRAGSGAGVMDADNNALHGIPESLLTPEAERGARSPLARKETRSNQSVAETSDTPRLSPVATSDHIRLRAERRVLKSVNDVINDVTSKTPTVPLLEGGGGGGGGGSPTPRPALRGKTHRRVSMQSLPKLSHEEEHFSIRRKIEQFRKWHEEQYTEKLKSLKVEAEKEKQEADPKPRPLVQPVEIDFAKILEENMKHKKQEKKDAKKGGRRRDSNGNPVSHAAADEHPEDACSHKNRSARCKSSTTWRTWRDVNESYAYDDVTKYIEENELLPPDRVEWIHSWLGDVHEALGQDDDLKAIDEGSAGKIEMSVDRGDVCTGI